MNTRTSNIYDIACSSRKINRNVQMDSELVPKMTDCLVPVDRHGHMLRGLELTKE